MKIDTSFKDEMLMVNNGFKNAGLVQHKFGSHMDKPSKWDNLVLTQQLGLSIFDPNLG